MTFREEAVEKIHEAMPPIGADERILSWLVANGHFDLALTVRELWREAE